MDRCALFVDAGYALADGAMAVHGTRRRDSVSWDHAGLLKLLAGLARDRTGLPVLRCYWYEIAEGRRTTEQDALAEMPGLKLRLVNTRPGRREGIDSQLRRDLVTLAKSGAIADAFIASADEHLAEIVSEVQDLGLRVVILHIASDAGWTVPQPLRQECDDIVEISGVHLRPFVDLIRGAEPAAPEGQQASASFGAHALAGGDGSLAGATTGHGHHAALPAAAEPYPAPVGSDYGATAQPYQGAAQRRSHHADADAYAGPPAGHVGSHGESAGRALPRTAETGAPVAQPIQAAQPGVSAQPGSAGQLDSSGPHRGPAPAVAQHPAHVGVLPQHAADSAALLQYAAHVQNMPQHAAQRDRVPQHASDGAPPQHAVPGASAHGQYAPNSAVAAEARTGSAQGGQDGASATVPRGTVPGGTVPGPGGTVPGGTVPGGTVPGVDIAGLRAYQPDRGQQQAPQQHPSAMPPGAMHPGAIRLDAGHPGAGQQGFVQHGAPDGYHNGVAPVATSPGHSLSGLPNVGHQNGHIIRGNAQNGLGANGAAANPAAYGGAPANGSGINDGAVSDAGTAGNGRAGQQNGARTGMVRIPDHECHGLPGSMPPGHVYSSAGGQAQQFYGSPSRAMSHGQPGPAGQDLHAREAYAEQYPGSRSFQPYPAQPQQALPPPVPAAPPGSAVPAIRSTQRNAISLPDAVKAAHGEGFSFGETVGRDAPGLWLEAVLARKPRMPSDLEARLLQGSVLPIESLLHDEVRHSLRRGFWDALESTRR